VNIAVAALSIILLIISDPLMAAGFEALLAVGYGISLRLQEYLKIPRLVPLTHEANSSLYFSGFTEFFTP
jgi:hypothetical protein